MKPVYAEHRNISVILIFIVHFSDISGVFTVPTHGLYQFSVSLLSVSGDAFDVRLMRNNTLLCKGYAAGTYYQNLTTFIFFEGSSLSWTLFCQIWQFCVDWGYKIKFT